MKKKKISKKRKVNLEFSRENSVGIASGILGFILTVIVGDFSSKNINETFEFNPMVIAESFAVGIQLITGFPRFFSIVLGWIFLFIPAVFFYFIAKWTYEKI